MILNTQTYQLELAASRIRVRQTLLISGALHVMLLLWLLLYKPPVPIDLGAVEIDWLDPAPPVVVAAPKKKSVAVREQPREKTPPAPMPVDEPVVRAEPKPMPRQDTLVRNDRLSERLATMRTEPMARRPLSVNTAGASSLLKSAAAPQAAVVRPQKTVNLNRDARPTSPAVALNRNVSNRVRPAMAPVEVPKQIRTDAARPEDEATDIERTLDGVTLVGPAAGREIVKHILPDYPSWAMKQAAEATVTLYFVVLPDGRVKDNVQIRKTGGYADFDNNATAALLNWRFAPLAAGERHEQWGTITFRYRLRDARR